MNNAEKNKFNGVGENEIILKIIHRNWFDIASQYFLIFFVAVIFFAAVYMYPLLFSQFQDPQYSALLLFIEDTFILAIWIYSFLIWIDYYFDVWIVTNERIINIEQKGLFMRKMSEAKYSKIQDISVEVTGFLQTIIGYGDVRVQTAGELENIVFRKVSNPYEIKNMIANAQKENEKNNTDNLGEMLSDKLNSKGL
ncbi:MAG: hypothetical protein ACD_11C00056G0004 [uncultured bacterium]|nr:MAG: hypothetical protein ACD_11C00056G0004 [uncultured bacterium]HBR71265.1 hypothetical protein [Candidatus Moranbacteria bacterium]